MYLIINDVKYEYVIIEYIYKYVHYKDTSSSSSWGQKSMCDS